MAIVKTVNAQGGSDARYDTSQMTDAERARFDGDGRPLGADEPGQWEWTPGLPGAREMNAEGGGGGGGGGGVGDLTADPYYQQYQSQIQAAQAADLTNTKGQLQQLLIEFGLVPEGFQDKYGALDDTIRQLIQQNTQTGVSQYARLIEARDDAQKAAMNSLKARGLSRSGAKGHALRRGSLQFDRSLSDALGSVLKNATQLQSGYASRDIERQSGLTNLLTQLAASRRPTFSGAGGAVSRYVPQAPSVPQPMPVYQSQAGPSPYEPVQNGTYTGGALFATPGEFKPGEKGSNINPIFYFK